MFRLSHSPHLSCEFSGARPTSPAYSSKYFSKALAKLSASEIRRAPQPGPECSLQRHLRGAVRSPMSDPGRRSPKSPSIHCRAAAEPRSQRQLLQGRLLLAEAGHVFGGQGLARWLPGKVARQPAEGRLRSRLPSGRPAIGQEGAGAAADWLLAGSRAQWEKRVRVRLSVAVVTVASEPAELPAARRGGSGA